MQEVTAETAYARKMDRVPVTAQGKVVEILADDADSTPHQKFIIEVHSSHTILISHNLLRAYRIPVKIGDWVEVHGTFVWNRHGGLIHNTHHDSGECIGPSCEPHDDGYINLAGMNKNPQIQYGHH